MINLEREFKTKIDQETYERLIKKYNLKNNIYIQENYYFDTENADLKQQDITMRVRIKDWSVHLTKKEKGENGTIEETNIITKDEALFFIQNGFKYKNYDVKNVASLKTYRVKFQYDHGTLFFDKNEYYGITDYEIEYEIDDDINLERGKRMFSGFLEAEGIPFQKQSSKSNRAIKAKQSM